MNCLLPRNNPKKQCGIIHTMRGLAKDAPHYETLLAGISVFRRYMLAKCGYRLYNDIVRYIYTAAEGETYQEMHTYRKPDGSRETVDRFFSRLIELHGYRTVSAEDAEVFAKYDRNAEFFDITFTGIYIWSKNIRCAYREYDGCIIVVNEFTDGDISCALIPEDPGNIPGDPVGEILKIFEKEGIGLNFCCVSAKMLPYFADRGFAPEGAADDRWSDYIYDIADFLALEGKKNRVKRYELSLVERCGSVISALPLTRALIPDCAAVFSEWCGAHGCEGCSRDYYYGCERAAFERLEEIYDIAEITGGVIYADGKPVAFSMEQRLDSETVSCIFAKNAFRIPGLTYYMHRFCAGAYPAEMKYMNWDEDMGDTGIRQNKQKYGPCALKPKYTVIRQSGERKDASANNE